jgi:uroporphyrinogen decarboxylase
MELDKKIDDLVEKIRLKATTEELTPLERVLKVAALQEPDRVPVLTQLHDHAARISGVSVKEMATDPKKLVYAQLFGLEKYHFDGIVIGVDIYNVEVESVGTTLSFPDWSIPIITKHAINDRKDLKHLSMPDPEKDGRMPYLLEASRFYHEKLGDLFPFSGNVTAPFSIAVNLRGFVNLLKDFREDPDFAHQLMRFATDLCIIWGETQKRVVGFNVTLVDAWGTLPNISPKLFDEFSLPYTTYAMGRLKCSCNSICRGLRLFPDWTFWARKVFSMGVSSFTVFQEDLEAGIDLAKVKQFALQHGRSFAALYDPTIIQSGTCAEIREKTHEYMRICAKGGAFLLIPNNIPAIAPPENVSCFVESIHKFGKYPIKL